MNEYAATRAVLRPLAALLNDTNDVGEVPPAERYTYAYDQHAQVPGASCHGPSLSPSPEPLSSCAFETAGEGGVLLGS